MPQSTVGSCHRVLFSHFDQYYLPAEMSFNEKKEQKIEFVFLIVLYLIHRF